jgi:hypothetical protein
LVLGDRTRIDTRFERAHCQGVPEAVEPRARPAGMPIDPYYYE